MRTPLPGRTTRLEIQKAVSESEIRTTDAWRNEMRRVRKLRGWTQAELGEIVGVEQSTISSIETGRMAAAAAVPAIAKALDIPDPTPQLGVHEALWLRYGQLLQREHPDLFKLQIENLRGMLDKLKISDEGQAALEGLPLPDED